MPDSSLTGAPLLAATRLCAYYGSSQALFDVSLRVPARGGVAILGRNGAGKTTLLKTLCGDLKPARGSIHFDRTDTTRLRTEQRVRAGIGYVPQEHGVFAKLTVRDNLLVGAMSTRGGESGIDEVVALFPRLGQRMAQQAGTLSGGERKMLAIGRALLARPDLLMLDEPTEGVWHEVVDEIGQRLEELARKIAIVIVEQNLKLALKVSDFCYVMDRGRIALSGESGRIRDDPELIRLLAP